MVAITRYIPTPDADDCDIIESRIKKTELYGAEITHILTEKDKKNGKIQISTLNIKTKSGRKFHLVSSYPIEICELVDDPRQIPGETAASKNDQKKGSD